MTSTDLHEFPGMNVLRMGRRMQGVALIYAMLASVCFLLFFVALTYSVRSTIHSVRYSEDLVKARAIAAMGNELAYHMVRSRGMEWLSSPGFTFSNDASSADYFAGIPAAELPALQAQFSKAAIGGTFRVKFVSTDDAEAAGVVVPASGTYMVMHSIGTVNNRSTHAEASSRFLVKFGTPFVNYLVCVLGDGTLAPNSTFNGPMLVAKSPPYTGDLNVIANYAFPSYANANNTQLNSLTATFGGEITTKGNLLIANSYKDVMQDFTIVPKGHYSAGQQITIPPPIVPNPLPGGIGIGGIQFSSETVLKPNKEIIPRVPPSSEVFDSLRALPSAITFNNVEDYPEGLLVEITGNTVELYKARRHLLGRAYDLGFLVTAFDGQMPGCLQIRGIYQHLYGSLANAYRAGLAEVEWDDPHFPDAPLPAALRADALTQFQLLNPAATLADIPSVGDYFDQYIVLPDGPPITTWTLSSVNWRVIRFQANALTATDDTGTVQVAPPVFVRGRVQGKLILAYDLADSLLPIDLENEKRLCDIVILGNSRGAVNGGVLLNNPAIVSDPTNAAPGSPDFFIALSRGNVKPWHLPISHLGWLESPAGSGNRFNMITAELPTLQPKNVNQMGLFTPAPHTDFFGVAAGGTIELLKGNFTANLRPRQPNPLAVDDICSEKMYTDGILWGDMVGPRDPMLLNTRWALNPATMRMAYRSLVYRWDTRGAHAAMEPGLSGRLQGYFQYDYRLRYIKAEELSEQMGFPVGPILIDRRGG